MSIIPLGFAYVCLVWSCFVAVVQIIGISRLFRYYSRLPRDPVSPKLRHDEVPHVTVIRPVKGVEPGLYECLASTLRQAYPPNKITIYFCVDSTEDPAFPILRQLAVDFPQADARIFVEAQDPLLHGPNGHVRNLGPNPKIRNLSRAYREAKGDIVWVVDANVWVGRNVAGRMVDKLCGFLPNGHRTTPYKFVHQVPVVVDVHSKTATPEMEEQTLLSSDPSGSSDVDPARSTIARMGGGRLEEMFMATTHAKFYSAINTVGIAPCIVGKSNMFRKSHLLQLTDPAQNPKLPVSANKLTGIDYFSRYICEDHMIGDLLFRCPIPGYKDHGLITGDFAVQPVSNMPVSAYIARRVRWLRARKWTVLAATLVEPGVESLLCNFYFSYAVTTIPWFNWRFGMPQTWQAMGITWLVGVTLWMIIDWFTFNELHAGESTEVDEDTPAFAKGTLRHDGVPKRGFGEWFLAWLGRETMALPIWTWAVLLGTTVTWRGKSFKIRPDMSVVELGNDTLSRCSTPTSAPALIRRSMTPEIEGGLRPRSKDRRD